jgi:hypothetical protein
MLSWLGLLCWQCNSTCLRPLETVLLGCLSVLAVKFKPPEVTFRCLLLYVYDMWRSESSRFSLKERGERQSLSIAMDTLGTASCASLSIAQFLSLPQLIHIVQALYMNSVSPSFEGPKRSAQTLVTNPGPEYGEGRPRFTTPLHVTGFPFIALRRLPKSLAGRQGCSPRVKPIAAGIQSRRARAAYTVDVYLLRRKIFHTCLCTPVGEYDTWLSGDRAIGGDLLRGACNKKLVRQIRDPWK